jgi:hypothetical protein
VNAMLRVYARWHKLRAKNSRDARVRMRHETKSEKYFQAMKHVWLRSARNGG